MIRLDALAMHDADAIDALLDAAFGAERRARPAYAIRRGMAWLTDRSFAAVDETDGALVGLLQSWPVALHGDGGAQTPLTMVGPVAVLPARQRAGVGRRLMDRLILATDADPQSPAQVMIGDADYYGRFWGFSASASGGWTVPPGIDPARLLVRVSPSGTGLLPQTGRLGPRRTG